MKPSYYKGWFLRWCLIQTPPQPIQLAMFSCQVQEFQWEHYQPWCDEIISCHPLMLQQKSTKLGLQNAENHLLRLDSLANIQCCNGNRWTPRHSINMAISEVAGSVVAVAWAATCLKELRRRSFPTTWGAQTLANFRLQNGSAIRRHHVLDPSNFVVVVHRNPFSSNMPFSEHRFLAKPRFRHCGMSCQGSYSYSYVPGSDSNG